MGKHVGISLILIVVIFFGAWLWGGPGAAVPEEEPTLPVESRRSQRKNRQKPQGPTRDRPCGSSWTGRSPR